MRNEKGRPQAAALLTPGRAGASGLADDADHPGLYFKNRLMDVWEADRVTVEIHTDLGHHEGEQHQADCDKENPL